ncbi:MAG: hypothetical protein QNJ68_17945 [Microcoleaceae cyanobacterium MO_207.B10]|nr:hypothetical protein [Microcoleaceae cyanobacterium MO_207.B10]
MAKSPKLRGYSTGRIKGYKTTPRTPNQVIIKGKKNPKNNEKFLRSQRQLLIIAIFQ